MFCRNISVKRKNIRDDDDDDDDKKKKSPYSPNLNH